LEGGESKEGWEKSRRGGTQEAGDGECVSDYREEGGGERSRGQGVLGPQKKKRQKKI